MTTQTKPLSEAAQNIIGYVVQQTRKCRGKNAGDIKARISLSHIKVGVVRELMDAGLIDYRNDTNMGDGYAATREAQRSDLRTAKHIALVESR